MRIVIVFLIAGLVWPAATVVSASERGGYALEFDGVNDYVEIGDPVNTTGPLTAPSSGSSSTTTWSCPAAPPSIRGGGNTSR